jgi:hypothetical protein
VRTGRKAVEMGGFRRGRGTRGDCRGALRKTIR